MHNQGCREADPPDGVGRRAVLDRPTRLSTSGSEDNARAVKQRVVWRKPVAHGRREGSK